MLKAKIGKELVLKIHNEIGVLAQPCRILSDKGINVLAASGWVEGPNAIVHLVTTDNLRAGDALRAKSYSPREGEVVLTESPHKPGLLRHITERLSQGGIDVHHLYASATEDQDKCLIVLATANNDRTVVLLNQ